MTPIAEYDGSGLKCPMPVLKAAKRIKALNAGDVLKVVADGRSALKDIPSMCNQNHYELLDQQQADGKFVLLIRR